MHIPCFQGFTVSAGLFVPLKACQSPVPHPFLLPSSSPSFPPSLWTGCEPTRSWWTCCRTPGWSRGRGARGGTAGKGNSRARRVRREVVCENVCERWCWSCLSAPAWASIRFFCLLHIIVPCLLFSGCFNCSALLSWLFIWFIHHFSISGNCNYFSSNISLPKKCF